jgi:ribosomal protein L10
VGAAVNPLNPENVFNQAAGAVVTQLTGREETLGGWLAEMIDPRARELARVLSAPPSVVATNPVHGGYL